MMGLVLVCSGGCGVKKAVDGPSLDGGAGGTDGGEGGTGPIGGRAGTGGSAGAGGSAMGGRGGGAGGMAGGCPAGTLLIYNAPGCGTKANRFA